MFYCVLILLASAVESGQEQTGESNADDAAWCVNVRTLCNDSFTLLMASIILAQTSNEMNFTCSSNSVCMCLQPRPLSLCGLQTKSDEFRFSSDGVGSGTKSPGGLQCVLCVFNSLVCFCLVHDLEGLFLSTPTNTHVLFCVRPLSLPLHCHRVHSVIHTLSVLYTKL